jgi:hypothetical protein
MTKNAGGVVVTVVAGIVDIDPPLTSKDCACVLLDSEYAYSFNVIISCSTGTRKGHPYKYLIIPIRIHYIIKSILTQEKICDSLKQFLL